MTSLVGLAVGAGLLLKKPHPCGNRQFTVTRVGSDLRIVCDGCGRELLIERTKLEKAVKKIVPAEEKE